MPVLYLLRTKGPWRMTLHAARDAFRRWLKKKRVRAEENPGPLLRDPERSVDLGVSGFGVHPVGGFGVPHAGCECGTCHDARAKGAREPTDDLEIQLLYQEAQQLGRSAGWDDAVKTAQGTRFSSWDEGVRWLRDNKPNKYAIAATEFGARDRIIEEMATKIEAAWCADLACEKHRREEAQTIADFLRGFKSRA
jgi:hypothetical protein